MTKVIPPNLGCVTPTAQEIEQAAADQAQADLADWHRYITDLEWKQGSLDESSHLAALRAASLKIPLEMVLNEIKARVEKAGDCPKDGKIRSQLQRAFAYVDGGGEMLPRTPKASFRPAALKAVAEKLPVQDIVAFVVARSPIDPASVTCAKFLSAIYPKGEKVVVFTIYESQGQALWPDCGDRLPTCGRDGVWYLINPVDGRQRWNPRTRTVSRRSAESVTSFRFLLLESDAADLIDWLKCLAQLPLRIVAIYESGGRSIHALVQIDAQSKADWDRIVRRLKPLLVTLGADQGALTAVRLSRLPQAKRGDRVQRLLYLSPNPTPTPICQLTPRTSL